jgi:transposase
VEVDRHYYSVLHSYNQEEVEVRLSSQTVEIFLKGQRIATHVRSYVAGKHTTLPEHRPKKHQDLEWTSSRVADRGRAIGPSTVAVLERIMQAAKHPELGYRACLGVLRLANRYPKERAEAACRRALALNICTYRSIKSVLENGLDRQSLEPIEPPAAYGVVHGNVRGAAYYEQKEVQ